MKMHLIRTTLLLSLWANLSFATEDLLDLYKLAVIADPQLKQSQIAHQIALEVKKQDFSRMLPSVNINGDRTENWQKRTADYSRVGGKDNDISKTNFSSYRYSLTMKQPLFNYENNVKYKKADERIKQASAELVSAGQALIIRLSERYFDVLAAQDSLRFIDAEKQTVEKQLAQAEGRLNAGLAAITDVYEAQAQLDTTIAQEIVAQNTLSNNVESLREITNQYHEKLKPLIVSLDLARPALSGVNEWETLALNNNLELVALRHNNKWLRQEIKSRRTGHYPKLDLLATYSIMNSGGGNFGRSDTENRTIKLQLNIPIYQGGFVSSQVKEALYLYEQNLEKLDASTRSVRSQVHKAYLGVVASIALVKSLKQSVMSNNKALKAIEAGSKIGRRTTLDILEANKKLHRAKRDYQRARYDYILNRLRLKQSAGHLSLSDLQQANSWLK